MIKLSVPLVSWELPLLRKVLHGLCFWERPEPLIWTKPDLFSTRGPKDWVWMFQNLRIDWCNLRPFKYRLILDSRRPRIPVSTQLGWNFRMFGLLKTLHTQTKTWISEKTAATNWSPTFGRSRTVCSFSKSLSDIPIRPLALSASISGGGLQTPIATRGQSLLLHLHQPSSSSSSSSSSSFLNWITRQPDRRWWLDAQQFPLLLFKSAVSRSESLPMIVRDISPHRLPKCPGAADKHTEAERHRLDSHQPFGTHKTSPGRLPWIPCRKTVDLGMPCFICIWGFP